MADRPLRDRIESVLPINYDQLRNSETGRMVWCIHLNMTPAGQWFAREKNWEGEAPRERIGIDIYSDCRALRMALKTGTHRWDEWS
jgi:hypothetical protein